MNPVLWALTATIGTWGVTALGAAVVLFLKKPGDAALDRMLGFAAGVMIAASFWSLLEPAVELARQIGTCPPYLTATAGFLCGAWSMRGADGLLSHIRRRTAHPAAQSNRLAMLVLSVTLHNIPEGLAVGVAFGALQNGCGRENLLGAVGVAVGIGLQNFPEGAAVSVPLRREGRSRTRSFLVGQASGMVEPAAGVVGALLVTRTRAVLPFALSFAAGAMILVAAHELIPECQSHRQTRPYTATGGIVSGFAVMMLLDVMLG